VPGKSREKLTFGVAPGYADAHTITGEFLSPIGRAGAALAASIPGRTRPLAAADGERR
jgi:hypothetical protein